MKAAIHYKAINKNALLGFDTMQTIITDCKEKPLWWHEKGLQYTATGYGSRIPTRYMVKVNNRWQRVYCICYSNSGTLFIGNKYDGANTVQIDV